MITKQVSNDMSGSTRDPNKRDPALPLKSEETLCFKYVFKVVLEHNIALDIPTVVFAVSTDSLSSVEGLCFHNGVHVLNFPIEMGIGLTP